MTYRLPYVGAAPVPRVTQETGVTCGPACLRAVVGAYSGRNLPEPLLARLAQCRRPHGTAEADLVKAARELGFRAWSQLFPAPEALRQFTRRGVPVICVVVSWNVPGAFHWIVVEAVEDDEVVIMDPHPPAGADNRRVLGRDEFARRWWHWEGWWLWREKVTGLGVVILPPGVEL
jgi:ABC-type bacteriocin/lantibiotic exporter with double-glycine peptidase domain